MRRLLLLFAFVLCAWPADDQAVIDWMHAHAIRLATPEAGHGFADMQPLKKVVGNARVVELGEATHGTREFHADAQRGAGPRPQLHHEVRRRLPDGSGFRPRGGIECEAGAGPGQVSRDDSMAENIKWILDHSPRDKLVVWAHNGHVKAGGEGYGSMGESLRKMYGDHMVVFGFAFNQGSFQAVEMQKGLHNWTVPPAPAGSLHATLAATGLSLLALDLRQVPKDGPVADWWRQPHKTRSIGAVYSETAAANYFVDQTVPRSYDVLLFVENTTAGSPSRYRPVGR